MAGFQVDFRYSLLDILGHRESAGDMVLVFDGYVEEPEYGISTKMVDDAVLLYYDVGTPIEEFIYKRSDLLGSALVNQRCKSTCVGKKHCDLREVARLPVDVSNVAQVRIFFAAVNTK